jgi:hypothetical protein
MDVIVTGLNELLAAFAKAEAEVDDKSQRVVGQGCLNIKKDWVRRWSGYAHIPHLPRAISYDVTSVGGVITGEVGPVRGRLQAGLADYIEYGTINNAPIPGAIPSHAAEEPKFERAMGDMAEQLLD